MQKKRLRLSLPFSYLVKTLKSEEETEQKKKDAAQAIDWCKYINIHTFYTFELLNHIFTQLYQRG